MFAGMHTPFYHPLPPHHACCSLQATYNDPRYISKAYGTSTGGGLGSQAAIFEKMAVENAHKAAASRVKPGPAADEQPRGGGTVRVFKHDCALKDAISCADCVDTVPTLLV
jgi:hypothetical protein